MEDAQTPVCVLICENLRNLWLKFVLQYAEGELLNYSVQILRQQHFTFESLVTIKALFYSRRECIFIARFKVFFPDPEGIICFYAKDKHIIPSGFGQN